MDHRTPPQNLEAEQAVIGACVLDKLIIDEISQIIKPSDFYKEIHGTIFKCILELREAKEATDIITISHALGADNLERAGGISGLTNLFDKTPSAANSEYYANIVLDCSRRRYLIHKLGSETASLYDSEKEIQPVLDDLFKLGQLSDIKDILDSAKETGDIVGKELESIWTGRYQRFIKTGFENFDNMFYGFERKQLIVLSAEPHIGKSTFLQQCVYNMAMNGIPTGYVCLDTDRETVVKRIVCSILGYSWYKIHSCDYTILSEDDRKQVASTIEMYKDMPIWLVGDESVGRTFTKFAAWARDVVRKHDLQCIFIDSATKFDLGAGDDRESRISDLINNLNSLAIQLKLPIVVIVEFSKAEGTAGNRLKGSKTWDYAPRVHFTCERDLKNNGDIITVKAVKNSNGPMGSVHFKGTRETFKLTPYTQPRPYEVDEE